MSTALPMSSSVNPAAERISAVNSTTPSRPSQNSIRFVIASACARISRSVRCPNRDRQTAAVSIPPSAAAFMTSTSPAAIRWVFVVVFENLKLPVSETIAA